MLNGDGRISIFSALQKFSNFEAIDHEIEGCTTAFFYVDKFMKLAVAARDYGNE